MTPQQIKPMGLAMVICDQVITEAVTNKKSLIGIFNQISAAQFPCKHSRLCIFVSVTGGHGAAKVELHCVNEDNNEQKLFGAEGQIRFANPVQVVEMNFEFNNVPFLMPGRHRIDFLCDGVPILQRPFVVKQLEGDKP